MKVVRDVRFIVFAPIVLFFFGVGVLGEIAKSSWEKELEGHGIVSISCPGGVSKRNALELVLRGDSPSPCIVVKK